MDDTEEGTVPEELREHLGNFDSAISDVETMLQPLLSMSRSEIVEKLEPLDVAKLDLVAVYSLNSLFWMYLNVCGVNPKEHAVKGELERIRSYMGRIKEAQDAMSKPRQRLDKQAAERFVKRNIPKSALWANAHKTSEKSEDGQAKVAKGAERPLTKHSSPLGVEESTSESSNNKKRKRKH